MLKEKDIKRAPNNNERDESQLSGSGNGSFIKNAKDPYFGNVSDPSQRLNYSANNIEKYQASITPSESGAYLQSRKRNNDAFETNSNASKQLFTHDYKKDDLTQGKTNFGNQNLKILNDEITTKQHLELQQGQPLRSLRSLIGMTNKLKTSRYNNGFTGILLFIWDTFFTIDLIYLSYHIYKTFQSKRFDDESLMIIYCVGSLNIISQALINICTDQKLQKAAQVVNKQSCDKFIFNRENKRFLPRSWEDLKVGDIIKIKKNCQVPADCLIIDIKSSVQSADTICYIKGGPFALADQSQVKRSCQNTQNKTGSRLSDTKFVQLLSGQIKWEYNSLGKYQGSLKLNENPAAFEFSNEHIVYRGSFVYLTEQIICMVLNVGDECRGNVMRERSLRAPSLLNQLLRFKEIKYQKYYFGEIIFSVRILQLIALAFTFLSWIMVIFLHVFLKSTSMSQFSFNIVLDYTETSGAKYFSALYKNISELESQYFVFFPYLIKIVVEFVIIFHNMFVIWDINLIPSNVSITNNSALERLSQLSHIVLSPSSILGYRQNVVMFKAGHNEYLNLNQKYIKATSQQALLKNKSQYQTYTKSSTEEFIRQITQQVDHLSDDSTSSDDQGNNDIDYLPITYNPQFKFDNQKVVDQLDQRYKGKEKSNINELLKYCVLSHSGEIQKINQNQNDFNQDKSYRLNKEFNSTYKFDEAQSYFANSFKYNFVGKKGQIITIKVDGKLELYEELAQVYVDLRQIPMMIQVIRPLGIQDGCTVIFKAPLQAIRVFMREDIQPHLDTDLQQMTKQGITALTFAKKELDCEYAADLYRVISEVQTLYKGNQTKLQETLMTLCENLDLIGILGIKPYLNYRNSMFMDEVFRNGIKVWLLSSELEYDTILQINSAQLLQQCTQPLNIKGQTERQVEEQLKACLKAVSDRQQATNEGSKDLMQQKTINQPLNKDGLLNQQTIKRTKTGNSRNAKINLDATKNNKNGLEVLFTNGYSLSIIMKDESLLKIFLILCQLCNCVVGSNVSNSQKANLVKAQKEFNLQANLGYILSIIGNSQDMYMLNEADVKIGLLQKYKPSDMYALTCMNVSELHSLTYILFKHASQLNRRLRALVNLFFYRTVLLMAILTYYLICSGMSSSLPFQLIYTVIFIHILTPLQYFLLGISHKDFGYDMFHRIFGEYRNNQFANIFSSSSICYTILKALFDAHLLCLFNIAQLYQPNNYKPIITKNGVVVDAQANACYNSIVLSLIQLKRMRDNDSNISFFQTFYFLSFLLSLLFVLEDENLVGITQLFQSPAMLFQLVFVFLVLYLEEFVYKIIRNMLPTKQRESIQFYKHVEEMIFMEEFEDSNQEFNIDQNKSQNKKLVNQIKIRDLSAINQNMLRLHRSDSMDQILERINIQSETNQGSTESNRSTLINKYLRLNDFNKELEYQTQAIDIKCLEPLIYSLYFFIAILVFQIIHEVTTKDRDNNSRIALLIILSTFTAITIGLIIILKRVTNINYNRILLFYILVLNVLANAQKSFRMYDEDNEMIYYSVIALSFLLRLKYYYSVSAICIISMICYTQLSFNSLFIVGSDKKKDYWEQVEQYLQLHNNVLYLFIWILYSYWDEASRKIGFVSNYRKQKEFQKAKQILNILVPSIVRSKILEGQKNFSEAQGMVTIVFCDIEGFDYLVQQYEGKELIELLDQTYNAFDQLCEQYGLQKIETVGKTYMACGGLKIVESKIDQRLLGNHFTVRVVDYSFEMLNVANSIKLKNGSRLLVKIGIHSGEVVTGVVGETKPQFSLIGDTVNKTSRVCSKCPPKHILISKETQKQLETYSNNFIFDGMEVFMKGLGNEKVYKVFKRRLNSQVKNPQRQKLQSQISKIQHTQAAQITKMNLQVRGNNLDLQNNISKRNSSSEINNEDYQEVLRTDRSQDSQGDRYSDQLSQSDLGNEVVKKFGSLKEDHVIVNNPTLNIKYRLVERPRFLIQFNQKEQEQEFQQFILKYYSYETIWFLIIKACFDSLLLFSVGWRSDSNILYLQLSWVLPYLIFALILTRFVTVSIINQPNVVAYSIILIVLYFLFAFTINTSQQIFDVIKVGVYYTCEQQLMTYILMVYTLRAYQTRSAYVTFTLFVISFGVHVFMNQIEGLTVSGFAELGTFISFAGLLAINTYFREMHQRKFYNNERIIDIEIENTEDLLSKLVPFHVLAGIKNDQRVVDVLDNVTLLYTDMVGFTQFSNNVKNPVEVVQLLSKLFSKFDQLTEAHGVYKVHTIGDCYVIMGYTGKTPKYRRTVAVQIEEAYKVVKVGLEMIEIIKEVRSSSTDPNLSSLDMRIGIHTGKIVGGIIGTKVVRYDIFGQDVLIANKMESNGQQGSVCISDATLALLKQNQFIVDTLDFTEHNSFEIGHIGKKVQSYLVEQIFMENSFGSSQDLSSYDGSSDEDKNDASFNSKKNAGFKEQNGNQYKIPLQSGNTRQSVSQFIKGTQK